jgi:hypothetical protein
LTNARGGTRIFWVLAQSLWFRRNKVVHGGDFTPPNTLSRRLLGLIMHSTWPILKKGATDSQQRSNEQVQWRPPPQNTYKVNWDAALDSVNQRMGVGVIVRDHMGRVIAARSTTVEFSSEPVVAEAIAALHAAEFSRDLGLPKIILEGDSLQVVNAVQDTGPTGAGMVIL